MSKTILKAVEVSKKYNINSNKFDNVRDVIQSFFSKKKSASTVNKEFWALKNISFELKKGEVLGIIGKNGSGKSTLLKILSQITSPTEGRITYEGRIASILDIGTGFHPDLSGRENVFLRGEFLGMKEKDIQLELNHIIAFSEIGEFIDSPVKHYSSGMFLRLAFAVSMFLKADILLLDEVISVGDVSFRLKCFEKLEEMVKSGISILLVSHNFNEITAFCDRCIWLDKGEMKAKGKALEVIRKYSKSAFGSHFGRQTVFTSEQEEMDISGASQKGLIHTRIWEKEAGNEYFKLQKVSILPNLPKGRDIHYMKDSFSISIEYEKLNSNSEINFCISIFHITGNPALSIVNKKPAHNKEKGLYEIKCNFPGNLLNHGNFYFSFWVGSSDEVFVESYQKLLYFRIACNPEDENTHWREVHAHVRPELDWEWSKKDKNI